MADDVVDSIDEFVDWKGRRADSSEHGGIKGSVIACVVAILENMVFVSYAINFVTYFRSSMHYQSAEAANMVTNFMGTSLLLTLLSGFISDSFINRFWTFILFCSVELLGLIMLTIQAFTSQFHPTIGNKPSPTQVAFLYVGLYAMAMGVGGVKATLPAHGADQLDHKNKRLISSYFNWYFFCICTGGLLAATIIVWVEDNKGWKWSFGISVLALSLALCIFASGFPIYRYKLPGGSPLTRIFKVIIYTIRNWSESPQEVTNQNEPDQRSYTRFRFLDKAMINNLASSEQVEETKTFLGLLPIFTSTIMMNCCLAQLQTFSVHQGVTMNRKLSHNFEVPTPSLQVFPIIFILVSIPLYEHLASLFAKKFLGKSNIFQPLRRIGLGLALSSGSMAIAAAVEAKRRGAAKNNVTLSVFWLGWQYLLLGVSDMLTLGGMLEFFYSEAPDRMRSICTSLSWCSSSMGFFLSSLLVSITNAVTRKFGHEWLGGNDLNHNRLDLFYTLISVLSFLNLINYMYWAKRY